MPFDKKDDNPYISGITVKITERYKRPPRIYLPANCPNNSNSAHLEEYDFRLERSVLSKMDEWKKAKAEERSRREERLKAWTKTTESSPEKTVDVSLSESTVSATTISTSSPSNILTPVYVNSASQVAPKPYPNNFNLSEFESDNSSPFDNMELKTINDMEVLASVLSSSTSSKSDIPSSNESNHSINNNFISNKNGYLWNKWDQMYNTYPSQFYSQQTNYPTSYDNPTYHTAHPHHQNHSQPQNLWTVGSNVAAYHFAPHISTDPIHDTSEVAASSSSDISNMQPKNNSKSVPDLVLELEKELKDKKEWDEQRRKTKTPPPRPTLLKHTGLEDWKPWPDLESPRHTTPDSIENLSSAHQSLARNVCDMGFPLTRVVRTIRKFQGDDKKVIEFLLQVQRLEDRNFSGDLAEKALHSNKYDENEAVKHLEATIVLLDLGFESDKVENVLLECQNDRDAALERLIS